MYSGRYLVKNKLLKFYLYAVYYLSYPISLFVKKDIGNTNGIKRVLVANGAHLGDITILISSINVLKASNPDLKVDLVTGSWNKPVINYYDVFDKVYFLDHWRLNRSKKSIVLKLLQYYKTFIKSCFLVRKIKYALAIDTYHFYPNSSLFLFFCGIKNRLGYSSGGFDNFYSQVLKWEAGKGHIAHYHLALFECILKICHKKPFFIKKYSSRLARYRLGRYIVVAPSAGDLSKMWNIDRWIKLSLLLLQRYDNVVLIGSGDDDAKICNSIACNEHFINLCNKTSLGELVNIINSSRAIVCLDSFISHFSAQFGISIFRIEGQNKNLNLWKPICDTCIQIYVEDDKWLYGLEHMKLITPEYVNDIMLRNKI